MADSPVSTSELETPEHDRELRIETICERSGWAFVALVLIAALLGLLGPGPLSYRSRTAADGSLSVEYNLIERYEAPAELRIDVNPKLVKTHGVRLMVSRSLVDEITLDSVSPIPANVEAIGNRMVYTFDMKGLAPHEGTIVARFQNDSFGMKDYDIGLEGHEALQITQYILP